ncbi:hypothetical protein [Jatrophihabitans sp.]|jgi:hypothetical protein|uniref:hypothetical protein n=1 Tax=Jatrophihabitans sp. TaxID=1932789 RepID=UPI002EF6F975
MTAVPADSTVPWSPEDLPVPAGELAALSYVVLEELVGSLVLLRRWSWPDVDQLGRLIWLEDSEHDSDSAAVALELLRAQLYTPNNLKRRPRCGDTFAARTSTDAGWQDDQAVGDLRTLFSGAVYDISADAREAAKLAYHAGLGAVPPAEKVDEQLKAQQAETLLSRASRPLRALKVTAPPRGLR